MLLSTPVFPWSHHRRWELSGLKRTLNSAAEPIHTGDSPSLQGTKPPSPGPEPLELPAGVHQLCSWGRGKHGWFCDGAHLGTGRFSYELRLSEPATVLMCRPRREAPFMKSHCRR
jgi:hypothetical protein